jgi:hypothetical protein
VIRRKAHRDPVSQELALAVIRRDGGCVAPYLGGSFMDCGGRTTLDHVKDEPRMGVRAPSDLEHLVTLCEAHHLWTGWATSHRPELRAYLREVNADEVQVDPYPASLL